MSRPARTALDVAAALLALGWTAPGIVGEARAQGQGGGGGPGGFQVTVNPNAVSFSTPGSVEFNQGHVTFTGVDVTVDTGGGRRWRLEVKADDGTLGGYGKPISELEFRPPSGTWTPIANDYQQIATGQGTQTVTVDFRVRLFYARDEPDTYGSDLTYRVSKQ